MEPVPWLSLIESNSKNLMWTCKQIIKLLLQYVLDFVQGRLWHSSCLSALIVAFIFKEEENSMQSLSELKNLSV